jgi:thiol-disulfide isomerase/thioredoxin
VLLNVWATWCTPCRKEMPALDRLQQQLGGRDFEVVALSIDRGGNPAVAAFYREMDLRALAVYVDPTSEATSTLRTVGIPTTLLVDRQGRELWRKTGPAEWDRADFVELLRSYLRGTTPS